MDVEASAAGLTAAHRDHRLESYAPLPPQLALADSPEDTSGSRADRRRRIRCFGDGRGMRQAKTFVMLVGDDRIHLSNTHDQLGPWRKKPLLSYPCSIRGGGIFVVN